MATLVSSKYSLKSLHEEIGLLDRKLAHLHKYDVFDKESDRESAAAKIEHKRTLLVRQARAMAGEGIEFQATDLPLSMREEALADSPSEAAPDSTPEIPASTSRPKAAKPTSPFSGTVLDGQQALQQYKKNKSKRSAQPAPVSPSVESAAAS